jgi:hypothetical protein
MKTLILYGSVVCSPDAEWKADSFLQSKARWQVQASLFLCSVKAKATALRYYMAIDISKA